MNAHQAVNIVMIEDDEGHARLIEKNIRRAGISNDIRHFTDGTTALDYLFNAPDGPAHNGPCMVLLDLNLPDMSGTQILEKIKQDQRLQEVMQQLAKLGADVETDAEVGKAFDVNYLNKIVD